MVAAVAVLEPIRPGAAEDAAAECLLGPAIRQVTPSGPAAAVTRTASGTQPGVHHGWSGASSTETVRRVCGTWRVSRSGGSSGR